MPRRIYRKANFQPNWEKISQCNCLRTAALEAIQKLEQAPEDKEQVLAEVLALLKDNVPEDYLEADDGLWVPENLLGHAQKFEHTDPPDDNDYVEQ